MEWRQLIWHFLLWLWPPFDSLQRNNIWGLFAFLSSSFMSILPTMSLWRIFSLFIYLSLCQTTHPLAPTFRHYTEKIDGKLVFGSTCGHTNRNFDISMNKFNASLKRIKIYYCRKIQFRWQHNWIYVTRITVNGSPHTMAIRMMYIFIQLLYFIFCYFSIHFDVVCWYMGLNGVKSYWMLVVVYSHNIIHSTRLHYYIVWCYLIQWFHREWSHGHGSWQKGFNDRQIHQNRI